MINPSPVTLEGNGVRLEPLERAHADALVAAVGGPGGQIASLWFIAASELATGGGQGYIDVAMNGQAAGHMVAWVVRELTSGEIVGTTRYHDIVPAIDRVEIGYTFYAQRWQRTHVNSACKLLLLTHAFETLGCQVVGFRVDNLNARSQKAVEAIGAKRDGIVRHFQARRDGSARDTYIYSIIASEWPGVKTRLEDRLRRLLPR